MLSIKIKYVIELTPQEFRVVSAALLGNLKENDTPKQLNYKTNSLDLGIKLSKIN